MTLNEKLIAVQAALKAPKDQTNAFGKYKYRSCEDILEAVKPLLKEQGLLLTLSDEIVMIGSRFYVKAVAEIDVGGEQCVVTAYAREEEDKKGMDGSQITGAASSYARKYALNGLFLIDDTKDSDATNDHSKGKKTEAPKAPDPAKELQDVKTEIFTLCGKDLGVLNTEAAIVKVDIPTMNLAEAKRLLRSINDRKLSKELDSIASHS